MDRLAKLLAIEAKYDQRLAQMCETVMEQGDDDRILHHANFVSTSLLSSYPDVSCLIMLGLYAVQIAIARKSLDGPSADSPHS